MILSNRLFTKAEPTRDAKVFYIFCEGKCREYEYFNYFRNISSKIKIEVIPPGEGAPTPTKLYNIACKKLIKTAQNPNPEYQLVSEIDEVWFVIDTDDWGNKITELRTKSSQQQWKVAQSNPCFEVWLYYHIHKEKAAFEGMHISKKMEDICKSICSRRIRRPETFHLYRRSYYKYKEEPLHHSRQ
ncbi:MAG: RloB family protein [Tannerellaceae bacterium]|nr:RloB family protein [Tannerellaceae bacterium]MCD8264036.1 RloB family protein [Tannerellaceae bacterium]